MLPIALELYRQQPEWQPFSFRVGDVDNGWQLTFVLADTDTPDGLVNAPIDGGM
jgi:hypothetical protein